MSEDWLTNDRLRGSGMTSQRARDRLIEQLRQQGISNRKVLEVMRYMPRHLFVDEAMASRAYDNNPLPIGQGQTISQPYIVARMSEALVQFGKPGKVLEIGTGCGYQTAILAHLADQVYSVERLKGLHLQAQARLRELAIRNVRLKYGDGFLGWPEYQPFDGILVTAAPGNVPPALLEQLAIGGLMVIPVGLERGYQVLQLIQRTRGGYDTRNLDPVSFVPMREGTG
jgi:protein-L-isoaspartate(D-aspartate) O-methyltransferase